MAYLSKETILNAYRCLSRLTADPSAQGATQATSSLRYLFALSHFVRKNNHPCNTQEKEDRNEFIQYVGEVVSIDKRYYTANFFDAIKDNTDYAVGSNFFSVNTVIKSLENPSKSFDFPKRGSSPLFSIQNGKLFERTDFFHNISSILSTPQLKAAFVLWLGRNLELNNSDLENQLYSVLSSIYSPDLISQIFLKSSELKEACDFEITFADYPARLLLSDFPSQSKKGQNTAEIIIKNELKDSYTKEELAAILKRMYDKNGVTGIHLFTLKYHKFIDSSKELLIAAGLSESYVSEISKMRSVVKAISSQQYGLAFYEDITPISKIINNSESKITHTDYIRAMRTKPFLLLAGISGTGKSRIVKQLAFESCPDIEALRNDPTSPGNYQLIEVKPNWHDSTEVLGYESEIGGSHYVVTPFVKFLVKAMLYEDKAPFFVCMDEMNLAPVEQYFAEFLSVLESRKLIDGKITSEPLIKADIFVKYETQLKRDLFNLQRENNSGYENTTQDTPALYGELNEVYDRLKKDGLRIPSNLIVVGTVNMDETTHQFSRKVIDRAMTIEMNIENDEKPFKDFFTGGDTLHYYGNPQPRELFLPKVVQAADALALLSEDDKEYLKANVPQLLSNLNKALDSTPFKIAYRVQNELVLYFFALREEKPEESAETLLTSAMDAILMMKVLPRIEGDEDLLEKPLKALAEFTATYPQASKKIAEMQGRLPQAHFTSFWP